MASPIKRIMSLRDDKGGSPLRSGKKKILKILRRPSFHQTRKHSDCNGKDVESAPVSVESQSKKPHLRDLEELRGYQKDLHSAILYFKLLIEKSAMEIVMAKIPDNTSLVLESIINIDNMLDSCLRLHGKHLVPYRKAMHQCAADLVKWTDQLLVRGNVKGNLDEGVEVAKGLEDSVQELINLATPRLQKLEVNDEIRNSIFLFQGSSESISVGGNNSEAHPPWVSRRDSGISEESIGTDSPPPKPLLPKSLRDSGRGSYNNIGDTNAYQSSPDSSPRHSYEGLLMPSDLPAKETNSQYCRSYSSQSHASSKESEWSLSQTSDNSYRSPPGSPVSSQEEFSQSAYFSARSSTADGFYSCEEGDERLTYQSEEESPIIQASFVGAFESHDPPPLPRKKTFQVYIELLDGYTQPSEDILKRPTSVYDGYQENFRRSISSNNASPKSPGLHNFPFRSVGEEDRSQSYPTLQQAKSQPYQQSFDHNRNSKQSETPKRRLLTLEEEKMRRKGSSASSSSLSSTDEDDMTPALDSLDVSRFLVHRQETGGSTLIGGAIDALIVQATSPAKKNLVYHEAFLTTYRTFIPPKDLINKLLYRERRFRERGHNRASKNAFFLLLRVVDELTGKVERSILEQLMKEVYRLLVNGDLVLGKILRDKMLPKCDHYYRSRTASANSPKPEPAPSSKFNILDFHSEDLAKQLTLMDAKNFLAVEMPEILAWGKDQKEEATANLIAFTDHFNKLSYWSRSYVLSFEKQQDRERVYQKFLKIMKHLRRFNDFNAFLAILSALDCSAVRRLDWPKQYLDNLSEYADLIDSSSSFRSYRAALAMAEPPCIPYLGLILQDVTFVYHGNLDELPDGKVNFVKRWQLFNILDTVRRFKLCAYDFVWNEHIANFFGSFDNYLSEEDLYEKSLELRPRS